MTTVRFDPPIPCSVEGWAVGQSGPTLLAATLYAAETDLPVSRHLWIADEFGHLHRVPDTAVRVRPPSA